MINIIRERIRQRRRTIGYPAVPPPPLPDRFRGLPVLDASQCDEACTPCAEACPTDAVTRAPGEITIDLGRCLFCDHCAAACRHEGAVRFTGDHRLATSRREDLIVRSGQPYQRAGSLEPARLRLYQRSLKMRQVSAGGDNAAECDLNVLGTVVFDIGRFGIQFVASPRHAEAVVVTGPVTKNMKLALDKTVAATPGPRVIIAVGADAISGGVFRDHPEVCNGLEGHYPIDLYVPGSPPHPLTILDGLLRLLGRLPAEP